MTVLIPEGTIADGAVKVQWVPTIATPAEPTLTEISGGLELSGFLTAGGFSPSVDQQTINDERLCTTQVFEQPGRYTYKLEIEYVYNQQAAAADPDNEAYETLKRNTAGFIVARWGDLYTVDWAAGDIVDVYPSVCGFQIKQQPEANSVLKCKQTIYLSNVVQNDVAILSGS